MLNSQTLDIHGGGQDLIFPHHENEIAQSEAYTGKPFVRYWIHNGFVTVNKEKMSKSLGNFFTLKDIFAKYNSQAVRLFLLSQHYRSPIDFSDDKLERAQNEINKFEDFRQNFEFHIRRLEQKRNNLNSEIKESIKIEVDLLKENFEKAMDNDFNTELALSSIYRGISLINKQMTQQKLNVKDFLYIFTVLTEISKVLGLEQSFPSIDYYRMQKIVVDKNSEIAEIAKSLQISLNEAMKISDLIGQRNIKRLEKSWREADKIRQELEKKGIILENTPQGTRWKKSK